MLLANNGGSSIPKTSLGTTEIMTQNIIIEIAKDPITDILDPYNHGVPPRLILDEAGMYQADKLEAGTVIEVSRLPNPDAVALLEAKGIELVVNPDLPFNREIILQKVLTPDEYETYLHYWYGDDPDKPFAYSYAEAEEIRMREWQEKREKALSDFFGLPFEILGKGVKYVSKTIGQGLASGFQGISEGIFGKDFKEKIALYGGIALIVLIGGLIAFYYTQTYVKAKATQKATT